MRLWSGKLYLRDIDKALDISAWECRVLSKARSANRSTSGVSHGTIHGDSNRVRPALATAHSGE